MSVVVSRFQRVVHQLVEMFRENGPRLLCGALDLLLRN